MSDPRRRQIATIFLIVLVDLIGFGMVIPFIPLWAERHHPTALGLAVLMAAYSTMQFLAAPVLGRFSDRFGRRPVLVASLLGSITGYLILATADSLPLLLLSRVIDGISGGNISTAHAVISDLTTPETRARGMGLIGAAFGLGFIVGPAVGGTLMTIAPWLPAVAAASTSLVALLMVLVWLPETRATHDSGRKSRSGVAAFSGLFDTWGIARLRAPLLAALVITTAFACFEMTFSLLLAGRFGFDERAIGLVLASVGLVAAVVQGGLIGRLVHRFGESRLVLAGALLVMLGLALVPEPRTIGSLAGPLVMLSIGMGIGGPSLSALTSKLAPRGSVGEVLGLYQALGSLGRVIGPLVGGLLHKGVGQDWPARAGAALMAIAVGAALVIRRQER